MKIRHEGEKGSAKIGSLAKSKITLKDMRGSVHLDIITVEVTTKKDRIISGLSTFDFRLIRNVLWNVSI